LISVQDTGAGMSHADQAAAFDPFRSFDKEGAGLALTLVRSFAELHGGWVKLNSEPGEGTTIEVFLPTSVKVAAAA
jgi:signal transduction histidine kinase